MINNRGDTPSTGLLNEISRLENLELSLYSQQLAREATFKQSQAILAELQSPGSSIAFAQQALSKLTVEQSRQLIASQLISEVQQREAINSGELAVSAMEELKAMIGLYQTDSNGTILRDNNGNGIISQEFADLGFSSSSSLNEILAGGRNASQLEGWANSVLIYLNNPYLSS
ncbi:MAG: hypothetical protein H3C43_02465 [Leptonema sp. (in: Bacteria)]|nr:hypothetical protein [Leptonema sp. (in: bacteria)]